MIRQRTFHGDDLNKATSLFEYGLLIRYMPKARSWQCIYKTACPPDMVRYSYGWIEETAFNEIFTKDWGVKHLQSFMLFVGSSWEEWKNMQMCRRISDFNSYFGYYELFSTDYSGGYTVKEICRKLHIRYNEDYELA